MVRSLIEFLVEHKCGARFTIAEGSDEWQPRERSKAAVDGWNTEWGGEFGGLSYDKMIRELSQKYPQIAFDRVDLNFDEAIELPLRAKALAYFIPKTIQQCDRIITVAPLATSEQTGYRFSRELLGHRARSALRLSENRTAEAWPARRGGGGPVQLPSGRLRDCGRRMGR